MLKKPNRIAKRIYFTTKKQEKFLKSFLLHYYYFFFFTLYVILHRRKKKKLCEKPIILAMSYSCVLFRGPFFFIMYFHMTSEPNVQRNRDREIESERRKSQEIMDFKFAFFALQFSHSHPVPGCH